MTELRTRESLLKALEKAASRRLTPEEVEGQRVSFIMGSLKEESSVTRSRVREVLAEQQGRVLHRDPV